jgi:hypothetical protein
VVVVLLTSMFETAAALTIAAVLLVAATGELRDISGFAQSLGGLMPRLPLRLRTPMAYGAESGGAILNSCPGFDG